MGRHVQSVSEEDYRLRACFYHHDTSSLAQAYLSGKRSIEYIWDSSHRCRMSFMSLALLTHNLPLASFLLKQGAHLNDPSEIMLGTPEICLQIGFLECLAWASDEYCIQEFQQVPHEAPHTPRIVELGRYIVRYFESQPHTAVPFIQNYNLIQALRYFKLSPTFYEVLLATLNATPRYVDISKHSLGLVALSLVREGYWHLLARTLALRSIDLDANWSIYPVQVQDEIYGLGARTALLLAIEKNKLEQVIQLLGAAADVNFTLQVDRSVEPSSQTFVPAVKGVLHDWTPLLASVALGNLYMVDRCVRAGAIIYHRSFDGTTAFNLAKKLKYTHILDYLRAPLQGSNALVAATRHGDFGQASTLLQGGANPCHVDTEGNNAFDVNSEFLKLPAMRAVQARGQSPYYFESFYVILIIH